MSHLHLFEGFGIELEYMLVDAQALDVRPIADRVLQAEGGGEIVSDVERGPFAWSNELALHVVEVKTNGPAAALAPLAQGFQQEVAAINRLAEPLGARLMPTAMHPWMDPHREMQLWPHDSSPIYTAFDRIFDCSGHGWANLQSMHINLPFSGDEEFGRLHAAIRLVLPILPALAAASPVYDGRLSGLMDSRLEVYRTNSRKIPSVAGRVIPEPAFDEASYDRLILGPLYADIAPHDPDGILQEEFLNARGAIARFSRGTIEIRVIDVQECPRADLAIASVTVALLQAIISERWSRLAEQQAIGIEPLEQIFLAAIRDADRGIIDNAAYLQLLGMPASRCTIGELWQHRVEQLPEPDAAWREPIDTILRQGPLARRITQALGPEPELTSIQHVYDQLCDCLARGVMFT